MGLECPNCGFKPVDNDEDAMFCMRCGTKLKKIEIKTDQPDFTKPEADQLNSFNEKGSSFSKRISNTIKALLLVLSAILGFGLMWFSFSSNNQTVQVVYNTKNTQVTNIEPETASGSINNQFLTVNDLISNFNDWEGDKTERTVYTLALGHKAILTIVPDLNISEYVKWTEMAIIAPNRKPQTLSAKELEPIMKLLSVLFPEWANKETWVYEGIRKLPTKLKKDNWELKLEYYAKEGLFLRASQNLSDESSTSLPNQSDQIQTVPAGPEETDSPRVFEKLVVERGSPIIVGASVEDDNGKAYTKSSSKFLGIWVSPEWYRLSKPEKEYFIKLHLNVFNEWKGDDEGIVVIYDDYLNKKIGDGNKFGIDVD